MPFVSIATGLYNHKPFIGERVRSILSQTLRDFEWIVVDDCSTDGSYEQVCSLTKSDHRVRVLRNSVNQGFMRTNQIALDQARGLYVYCADSDDSCDAQFLAVMTTVMETNPEVGFAYCRSLRMDTRNGVWGGFPRQSARYIKAPQAFPELALNYTIRAPSLLFRRAALERVGGFYRLPPGVTAEWHADWHLALRVALISDLVFHPEPLAYHRTHTTNLSRDFELMLRNFSLLEDVFNHLPESAHHFQPLRHDAYRHVAEQIYPALQNLKGSGRRNEFDYGMEMIRKYVPDFKPARRLPLRGLLNTAAMALIKIATYRRLH